MKYTRIPPALNANSRYYRRWFTGALGTVYRCIFKSVMGTLSHVNRQYYRHVSNIRDRLM